MYSCTIGCVRADWLYLGNKDSIPAKKLYLAKVVVFGQSDVFGQNGCVRAKLLYSGKSVCIRRKWLYSGKLVECGKSGCIRETVVAFGQKWL